MEAVMENIEYRTIDKSEWDRGPWDAEPDKVQFTDEATGMPCLAVRNPEMGFWCGYVGVSEGHPAFGKGYDDVSAEVHGGLTFADTCQPSETDSRGICHIPAAGEPDHVWWLGFDCAHAWDISPGRSAYERRHNLPEIGASWDSSYRTLAYVKRECANLARQLAAMC
jgi:hypothetical protein